MIKTLIYFYTTFIIRIPSFLVIFKKILLKTGTGETGTGDGRLCEKYNI